MMSLTEKLAYIQGLCEGLALDETTKEGKVLLAVVELLDDLTDTVSQLDSDVDQIFDELDAIDEDLTDVEDALLYDDEDEDWDDEEDDDEQSRDNGQDAALVPEAAGEEVGDGEGVDAVGVHAETLGHEEPVEVGADGQTDGRPGGLCQAAHHGDGGQTHEEPAAHIRGLGAHGGDQGAQLTAAEEEITRGLVLFGNGHTDGQHHAHVQNDGT